MGYKIKLILYYINKLVSFISILAVLFFLVMFIAYPEEWLSWLTKTGISFGVYILSKIIHIIRKSKMPVPGMDYY